MSKSIEKHAQLIYQIRALKMSGTVLQIGAHPDDEEIGILAYLTHKYGIRAVYWSATRGEGGQNRISNYTEEALGIYRTWESLAAREIDGGEALFGPFLDYGYSKNGEEALDKWGKGNVIREIVRAIRLVQPQIVISRWTGTPSDAHGHHQAIGLMTAEAFEAASDVKQFPELKAQGLLPWSPLKLYFSTMGDWNPGEAHLFGQRNLALEQKKALRINTGEFDPITGGTYQERAWLAFNKHQTQAMGWIPEAGDFFYYFTLQKSKVSVPEQETSFFDGIDPSLAGAADIPGLTSSGLRSLLESVTFQVNQALHIFRADDPLPASYPLLEALSLLQNSNMPWQEENWKQASQHVIQAWFSRKIISFHNVISGCQGFELQCLSQKAKITPGEQFQISVHLRNYRNLPIDQIIFTVHMPKEWISLPAKQTIPKDQCVSFQSIPFEIKVPETAELTCPYWLVQSRGTYVYLWPEGEPCGRPFSPSTVQVSCELISNSHRIHLQRPVISQETFPGGYRELDLAIIPPISMHPKNDHEFLQYSTKKQSLKLWVMVQCNHSQKVEGTLNLQIPTGWHVYPENFHLTLKAGEAKTLQFKVKVPAKTPEGKYPLQYHVRCGDRDYAVDITPVRMGATGHLVVDHSNCIKEELIVSTSQDPLHIIDVHFEDNLKYAYIEGPQENVISSLTPFGLSFHVLSDQEIDIIELDLFDAIVIGPNAYLTRAHLRNHDSRFLDYVEKGGTLIVQYQGYSFQTSRIPPFPFEYHQPHDRVTSEEAPVTILDPNHPVFRYPNNIQSEDFDHWVKDRGLYFFGKWDKRYQPLLSCADPGEDPKHGGLLIGKYGGGTFLYTGYSFFRQLPWGNPGAFRLFANILALPNAQIRMRVKFLKKIPSFSVLSEEQLAKIAHIMIEEQVEDGNFIFQEGEEGQVLYIIYRGEVEISTTSGAVKPTIVGMGKCIGELAILGKVRRKTSMVAKGDVQLLELQGSNFRSLLYKNPDMAVLMIEMLANQLSEHGMLL